jgi:hypothetical protein
MLEWPQLDLHIVLLSMGATFVYVMLRALQQLNVVHGYYFRIIPTSLGMGFGDVLLVVLIIKTQTLWMGLTNGIAGACGCYAAMYLTKRLK